MGILVKLKPGSNRVIVGDIHESVIKSDRVCYVSDRYKILGHIKRGDVLIIKEIEHREGMTDSVLIGYLKESKDEEQAIAAFETFGLAPEAKETPAQIAARKKAEAEAKAKVEAKAEVKPSV
jgi:hypothetical protein